MKYIKMWLTFCVVFVCLCSNLEAQNANEVTIKSVVHDDKGAPVSGVVVSGNEGKTVVQTDEAGAFTITVPANSIVVINGKGFKMQTLRANAIPARIGLTKENTSNEVYLPFDKVDRQDVHGAISTLNPETYIDRDFNLTVEGGMNGRVPGLLWSNNIWGMENAIVMIDGIRREFSDITFPEVQQISVLKGVNAVALYGAQAAKGIIFITTKKGEAGGRKISLRVNSGVALPRALPKFLNSADYMTLFNEARTNDGLFPIPEWTPAFIENHRTGNQYRYPNVDYYSSDYLKKFQRATDANAEFSGGSNIARFYSNIGWSTGNTLMKIGEGKNERDNRLNIRGNVDLKLNDRISSSIYVSAIFSESRRARNSVANANYWSNAATLLPNRFTPLIPVNLITANSKAALDLVKGSRNLIDGQYLLGGLQGFQTNSLADLYSAGYDDNIQRVLQVTNTINADLSSVLQGLSFHTLFNLDYRNSYLQSISNTYAVYVPTWSATGDSITGLQKLADDQRPGTQNINNTAQRRNNSFAAWFGYDRTVNAAHNISAKLLGYTSSLDVSNVYQPVTNSHLGLQLAYNFKHKYWADFSGAYVNSTRLPEGNRTGFSPTVSLGWLLSSENFLAGSKAINRLKLSVSAGILNTDLDITRNGQDAFFIYNDIYTRGTNFQWNDGVQGSNQTTTSNFGANPDLGFAKRKEVNLSLEGSFFNDLLTFQTTLFKTEMGDLPTQRFSQYPSYFSTFVPYTNYNANKRSGFDLMLNVNKKVGNVELSLGTALTYTTSEAKRDELYPDAYQNSTGKPVDAIFGLVSNGFFMDQNDINNSPRQIFGGEIKPGDLKYVDQNGDQLIDFRDAVHIGRFIAPLSYGINLNVGYKGFNLFVLGTGQNGGDALRSGNYFWVSGDIKYSEVVLNRWTEATKTTATYPRLSSLQSANNFRSSDFWLYKTDRFNLAKVQLSYTLPDNIFGSSFVKGLMVYVAGANLYTFSKNRELLDLNIGTMPQFRNFNAGIRAKF
jgi:TonB-linked SusC/RagA family outer membrane protein